ncbi:MAG: CPBP family intramembrane metalloprotease [Acidobacteriia bacterium]|nr:CPBP family intramembrane metalloprotease [Terriglobia bacterium]
MTPAIPRAPEPVAGLPADQLPAVPRDPVWSGLDVFRLLIIALVILFASVFAMLAVVPGATFKARALRLTSLPELMIVAQMFAYLLVLGYMYILVTKERRSPRFWKSIHWNWPANIWPFMGLGLAMQIVFLLLGRFLPFPKETPFDALLRRPATVVLIAVFAVTLGPLMEELFFRGFFYPVLARRFGMGIGISVSALGFGLMHAAQYGYSWASVLLIFLVGLVLGTVRAKKDSVAAGVLVHAGYNGTIILMLLIATDGFRHLEKLSSQ